MAKETSFGVKAITRKTPEWAKWTFRVVFILTTVATFIIASDPAINDALKVRIGVYLKGLDMLIYGVSKLFGEDIKPDTDKP
jgi:hypothetical protein